MPRIVAGEAGPAGDRVIARWRGRKADPGGGACANAIPGLGRSAPVLVAVTLRHHHLRQYYDPDDGETDPIG